MKKRFLPLLVALVLCFGLVSPSLAFAPPGTDKEAFKDVTLSYSLGDGVYCSLGSDIPNTWVGKSWVSMFDGYYDPEIMDGYYAVRNSTEFTLTFEDSDVGDNSYIEIHITPYGYFLDEDAYIAPDMAFYYYVFTDDGEVILDRNVISDDYVSSAHPDPLELKAGESVKFPLWDEDYRFDTIYCVDLRKWYPDTIHEESYYDETWMVMDDPHRMQFYFKLDDVAVENYLANLTDPATTAYANTQTVLVDGKSVEFQTYALKDANGNLTNYIKVRDVAYYLNGTKAQFEVGWNAKDGISLTSGKAYSPNGSELSTPFSGDQPYEHLSGQTTVNGKGVELDAISLDNGSFTYYKLRDLGRALDFNVSYINGQIVINTNEPYSDAQ
ncbi:MAG: hypothetical protein K2K53_07215 [Oscillospiraceae bacterium]|nr:hypothetical protein [Oscillospiraceae bacterium]